jgi:hypothetical protein
LNFDLEKIQQNTADLKIDLEKKKGGEMVFEEMEM